MALDMLPQNIYSTCYDNLNMDSQTELFRYLNHPTQSSINDSPVSPLDDKAKKLPRT